MADPKPKARRAPAKKARPAEPEKSQGERFIEAAREAGYTDEGFEKAMGRIVPPKQGER